MCQCMNRIRDYLYLGSASDAMSPEQISNNGITHVLTLMSEPLPPMDCHQNTKFVRLLDCESEDLLIVLEECLDFIKEAAESGGKVVVHCIAGVSRSSSVVIGHLMRSEKLNFFQAYKDVARFRPIIWPNDGFVEQLRMFELTNCTVDMSHPMYKMMKLRHAAENSETGAVDVKSLSAQQWLVPSAAGNSQDDTMFRCKKCRSMLFSSRHIVSHPVGQAPMHKFTPLAHRDESEEPEEYNSTGQSEDCRPMIFTMALDWMEVALTSGDVEGKLSCVKCSSRLGHFSWSGSKCPCGFWVVPSFSFPRSRVDECAPAHQVLATARYSAPPAQQPGAVSSSPPSREAAAAAAAAAGLTMITSNTEAMTISVNGDSAS